MNKLFRSQAGFTITEIMVVIALSGFLMAAAATGFGIFFRKFNDLSKFSYLQKGAFNCLQTIRNGIAIKGAQDGTGRSTTVFSGVASADSVIFLGSANLNNGSDHIRLFPPSLDELHRNDYVDFYLYRDRVWAKYVYYQSNKTVPVFPTDTSRNNDIIVTDLKFSKANQGLNTRVIKVDLVAKIKDDKHNNNQEDELDPAKQLIQVSYTTKMALTSKN